MTVFNCAGLERKVPRVLSRVGAIQCLSPLSLEELKLLSPAECGEELARCLDEVSILGTLVVILDSQ